MLAEFIEFVESVLPAVPPEVKDRAKAAIRQFEGDGNQAKFLMLNPLDNLSQGDVISRVPFSYFDESGTQKVFTADGIIISTSCHIDQKDKIIMAPVLPLSSFQGNLVDLRNNTIFDYMYIQEDGLIDKYIDFEFLNTYDKDLIMRALDNDVLHRICSFNMLGYYLFIVKLSVYLMRREDDGTLQERSF